MHYFTDREDTTTYSKSIVRALEAGEHKDFFCVSLPYAQIVTSILIQNSKEKIEIMISDRSFAFYKESDLIHFLANGGKLIIVKDFKHGPMAYPIWPNVANHPNTTVYTTALPTTVDMDFMICDNKHTRVKTSSAVGMATLYDSQIQTARTLLDHIVKQAQHKVLENIDDNKITDDNKIREDFLAQLRRVSAERSAAWANGEEVCPLFHATEFSGEAGEVSNEVKKLYREQKGWRGSRTTVDKLADEMADVLICLDKLAAHYNIDLAEATRRKFNQTSDNVGLPHKL